MCRTVAIVAEATVSADPKLRLDRFTFLEEFVHGRQSIRNRMHQVRRDTMGKDRLAAAPRAAPGAGGSARDTQ